MRNQEEEQISMAMRYDLKGSQNKKQQNHMKQFILVYQPIDRINNASAKLKVRTSSAHKHLKPNLRVI